MRIIVMSTIAITAVTVTLVVGLTVSVNVNNLRSLLIHHWLLAYYNRCWRINNLLLRARNGLHNLTRLDVHDLLLRDGLRYDDWLTRIIRYIPDESAGNCANNGTLTSMMPARVIADDRSRHSTQDGSINS